MKALFPILCVLTLVAACATKGKPDPQELEYKIQDTTKLEAHFKAFVAAYQTPSKPLDSFFADRFYLETIRPITHHREMDTLWEVKQLGFRKGLFGNKLKVIDTAYLKPWVLAHIEVEVKNKKVKDLALLQIDDKGVILRIFSVWSAAHLELAYDTKIKSDSEKSIDQGFQYIAKGYNDRDLKSALKVIPDYITFLKMNPYGIRDLSLTGEERKKFLEKNLKDKDMWNDKRVKYFIAPPYGVHHVVISEKGKVATERIVLRHFEKGKLDFTINFVGDEEHRIHLLEDFYKENPLFRYQFF